VGEVQTQTEPVNPHTVEESLVVLTETKRKKWLKDIEHNLPLPCNMLASPPSGGKRCRYDRDLKRGLTYQMVEVGEFEHLKEQEKKLLTGGVGQAKCIVDETIEGKKQTALALKEALTGKAYKEDQ
jgi:hypothetical protein